MGSEIVRATSRRRFLQYLAASPLFASGSLPALANEAPAKWPDPMIWTGLGTEPIKSPKDAINVFDFEPAAFNNVPPAHFGYMASGLDDEVTLRGGRGEENGRSTIDALPEILAAVKGEMPVFIDGGFRRGTDAIKALAMGARAVGIGRPYLWGLGAFGEEGVARVLEIMRTETRAAMQQCGVRSLAELNPNFVRRAS